MVSLPACSSSASCNRSVRSSMLIVVISHPRLQAKRVFHRWTPHRIILEACLAHDVAVEAVAAVEDDRLIHRRRNLAEGKRGVLRPVGQQRNGVGAGGGVD